MIFKPANKINFGYHSNFQSNVTFLPEKLTNRQADKVNYNNVAQKKNLKKTRLPNYAKLLEISVCGLFVWLATIILEICTAIIVFFIQLIYCFLSGFGLLVFCLLYLIIIEGRKGCRILLATVEYRIDDQFSQYNFWNRILKPSFIFVERIKDQHI